MAIRVGEAIVSFGADVTPLNKALGDMSRDIRREAGNILKVGRDIGMAMTGIGVAITGPLVLGVNQFQDFNKGMREVNSLVNLSEPVFQKLSQQVRTVATTLGTDAKDAVRGLYEALSAGVPTENAISFLTVASKAAIAGVSDTKVAIDGLTTVINAWKLSTDDAGKVADQMFIAVKLGKTTFAELASSMSTVAPLAAATGLSLQDVLGAVTTLNKQGVPTAEARTQIRSAIVGIITPNKEMNALFKEIGVSSGQVLLQSKGLQGAFEALAGAANGNNEALAKAMGRVEGLGAVLTTTGANAKGAREDLAAVGDSAGAMGQAFAELQKGRAVDILGVQIKDLAIGIGAALQPAISAILPMIQSVVQAIGQWMSDNPGLTAALVTGAGAVGAFSLALGPVLIALPGIVTAVGALPIIFTALTGPIGLAVLAIGGLVAAGVALWTNSETVRDTVKGAWGALKTAADEIFGNIKAVIETITGAIKGIWEAHKDWIGPFIEGIWNLVKGIFEGAFTSLKGVLDGGLAVLKGIVEVWTGIFTGDWDKFMTGVKDIWSGVWTALSGIVDGLLIEIKASVTAVWDATKGLFEAGKEAALGLWRGLWNALTGIVTGAWDGLKGAVQGVTDGVTGFFSGMYDKVVGKSIVPDMMTAIKASFDTLSGGNMLDPTKSGISSVIGLFSGAFDSGGSILTKIGDFGTNLKNKMKSIGTEMANAFITWGINKINDALGGLLNLFGFGGSGSGGGGATNTAGSLAGAFLPGGGGLGAFAGAAGGAVLGAQVLGPAFGGGVGGTVAGAGAGFLAAELASNVAASLAAGTGFMSGVTGFITALGPWGIAIAAAVIGIGALIGWLTKGGRKKRHDTEIVDQGWPAIWGAYNAYNLSPVGTPEEEIAARTAILGAGVAGWNEMVAGFQRPESRDTQRQYILDFINAVNNVFTRRTWDFSASPDDRQGSIRPDLVDLNSLPIQPLARGGIIMRPTLALMGEEGPEAVIPLKKGRRGGMGLGATINQTNYFGQANDLLSQRRMLESVNRSLARQLV